MAETKRPANPFVNAEAMEQIAQQSTPMTEEQFRLMVVGSLARLETQMKALLGNGRPGSIERITKRLHAVELKCAANNKCRSRRKR